MRTWGRERKGEKERLKVGECPKRSQSSLQRWQCTWTDEALWKAHLGTSVREALYRFLGDERFACPSEAESIVTLNIN
jgi:hypothetical protein